MLNIVCWLSRTLCTHGTLIYTHIHTRFLAFFSFFWSFNYLASLVWYIRFANILDIIIMTDKTKKKMEKVFHFIIIISSIPYSSGCLRLPRKKREFNKKNIFHFKLVFKWIKKKRKRRTKWIFFKRWYLMSFPFFIFPSPPAVQMKGKNTK